jgi:hypothetical protein
MSPDRAPSRRRLTVALALVAAVFAATLSALTVVSSGGPTGALRLSAAAIIELCPDDAECQAEQVIASASEPGLSDLERIERGLALVAEITELSDTSCHTLFHALGRLSFDRYANAVLDLHTDDCSSGFTHGWMVALTDTLPLTESTGMLAAYCRADTNASACVHGIGHAFGQDAMAPLGMQQLCVSLTEYFDAPAGFHSPLDGCVGGWIMESTHPVRWTEDAGLDDIEQLCAPLSGEPLAVCNATGLRRWAGSVEFHLPRLDHFARYCRDVAANTGVDDPLLGTCVGYFGEALARHPGSNRVDLSTIADRVSRYCDLPRGNRCVDAAVNMLVAERNNDRSFIAPFCRELAPAMRENCLASATPGS